MSFEDEVAARLHESDRRDAAAAEQRAEARQQLVDLRVAAQSRLVDAAKVLAEHGVPTAPLCEYIPPGPPPPPPHPWAGRRGVPPAPTRIPARSGPVIGGLWPFRKGLRGGRISLTDDGSLVVAHSSEDQPGAWWALEPDALNLTSLSGSGAEAVLMIGAGETFGRSGETTRGDEFDDWLASEVVFLIQAQRHRQ